MAVLSWSSCLGSGMSPSFSVCTSGWPLLSVACSSSTPKNSKHTGCCLKTFFIKKKKDCDLIFLLLSQTHYLFLLSPLLLDPLKFFFCLLVRVFPLHFFPHAIAHWKTGGNKQTFFFKPNIIKADFVYAFSTTPPSLVLSVV